jgi:hypothetical protein
MTQKQAKIGSLWIGARLSWIEQASITSFLETGHDYVLYTYGAVENAPEGVEVRDAREVWDNDEIIYHAKANSPAIHADVFRVVMAQKTGRVWADTDIIALRPFPAGMEWFIGHERTDRVELGNAILGLPFHSKTLSGLVDFLTAEYPIPPWLNPNAQRRLEAHKAEGKPLHLGDLAWGQTGPRALTYFAEQSGEIVHAQPQGTFFPVSFQQRKMIADPKQSKNLEQVIETENSLCVHLYSRWLRKFMASLPGQHPKETSWLGQYLSAQGIVSYPDKKSARQKAPKPAPQKPVKRAGKVDPDAFYADLENRRRAVSHLLNNSPHGRVTAITMAKDEGPYVLEWVAHHHLLGFTDILAYSNDCTDGTAEMFDALHQIGLVTHCDNPEMGDKPPQSRALKRATQHPLYMESDWVMVLDLDEFFAIRHADGRVDGLIDVIIEKEATAMPVTWRFYGSAGHERYADRPVAERFNRAASDQFYKGFGVKTLFKYEENLRLGIHRPRMKRKTDSTAAIAMNWINGSGFPVDGRVMSWRQTRKSAGYAMAQVNHYGVKSREEYLLRRLRGDVLNNHGKYDAAYFHMYDRNEIEDGAALRLAADVRALVDVLRKFEPVLQAEVLIKKRYAEKLERLRGSDNYNALMAELAPGVEAKV